VNVQNTGYDTAQNIRVTLTKESPSGDVLETLTIPALSAGNSQALNFTLDSSLLEFQSERDNKLFYINIHTDSPEGLYANNGSVVIVSPTKVDNVSLKVRKGEVVGIAGLMGAGRTELALSIFGKSYGTSISGTLKLNGKVVTLNSTRQAIDQKLAYVTEDRKGDGLILSNPIRVNTTLAKMEKVSKHGVIDKDKEAEVAKDYKDKLKTKCPSIEQYVGNLSGGNQQKVLLSKWMFADPDIMILDEPTRGIDVGAKYEIYCIINQLVAEGKSVLMISSELPEIIGMCDRIYIMNEGKMVGEVSREDATQEVIIGKILKSSKGVK
jgi:putative multiple sugar transport system ATP-binding protein